MVRYFLHPRFYQKNMTREMIRSGEGENNPRIEDIYQGALRQHEAFRQISEDQMKAVIRQTISTIDQLEMIGERDKHDFRLSDEDAKKIAAIWVFSGPGTYDSPTKDDRYKDYAWAAGMDRVRLNYAARLARRITEAVRGEKFKAESLTDVPRAKQALKEAILHEGPYIIYNGTQLENAVVEDVLAREGTVIPQEKVEVIKENINTTVDQIKTFRLPPDISTQDREIALVSHAPHLARVTHMLNRYQPFPETTGVRLFPLPTPAAGKTQYADMEIMGLLYYIYLSPGQDATEAPYPYLING